MAYFDLGPNCPNQGNGSGFIDDIIENWCRPRVEVRPPRQFYSRREVRERTFEPFARIELDLELAILQDERSIVGHGMQRCR